MMMVMVVMIMVMVVLVVVVVVVVMMIMVVVSGGDGGDDATDSGDGRHQAVCHDVRGGKNTSLFFIIIISVCHGLCGGEIHIISSPMILSLALQ